MKRVLILGGGFGGIATAHRLKQKLASEDEVILVDRRDYFMVGFRKSWALVGESPLEAGQRSLDGLARLGVRVMHDPVTRIDPGARAATMGDQRMGADALVVALGVLVGRDLHRVNLVGEAAVRGMELDGCLLDGREAPGQHVA